MYGLSGISGSMIFFSFLALIFIIKSIKIVKEYERGVVFRLGRLLRAKGPGLFILIPFIDSMVLVDMRTLTLDVPSQDVITKDNVPVKVNAVVYFRIVNAEDAVVKGPKLYPMHFRRRKNSKKRIGHRQKYLQVTIDEIKA